MENNSMASASKTPCISQPKTEGSISDHEEESGWTYYIEDFLNNNNKSFDNEYSCNSFSSGDHDHHHHPQSGSLVSDAAFSAMNKVPRNVGNSRLFLENGSSKKSSFRRRKARGGAMDNDLEDTASSPVNSPKICDIHQLYMNQKELVEVDTLKGKNNSSGQSGLSIIGNNKENGDLKKKGLCLVPVSVLSNYFG